ncbi:MAG: hypothetical protein HY316_07190 [Acidobacteria bacterium]|nr:hypothetical protein [Acidobacteriota bacterium]
MKTIFEVAPQLRFIAGLLVVLLIALASSKAQAQTLYSIEPQDDQLHVIDPATGATLSSVTITLAGNTVNGATALATDPSTQTLYAILRLSAGGGRRLVTINPTTGVATLIGNTGMAMAGLAFDCNDVLYGVSGEETSPPESLFTINKTTGAPTFLLGLGAGDDGEAIGFNPADGFLYHSSGHTDACGGPGPGTDGVCFERINLDTLEITSIDISGGNLIDEEAQALAWWEAQGVFLWKQDHGTGPLFRVTADGADTLIGEVDHQAKGLAFVPTFACGPTAPPIIRFSGNGQTGLVGAALPLPLVVKTQTPQGAPLPGVSVNFLSVFGGGSVSPSSATSNAQGLAQTTATLGPAIGANTFNASIATSTGLRAVNFGATGVTDLNPPPADPIIKISKIVNGATFELGPGLAPISIASVIGTNLASAFFIAASDGNTADATAEPEVHQAGQLHTTLEGTRLFVNSIPAPLYYVSATQINFQVPPQVQTGTAQVQVVWPNNNLPIVSPVSSVPITTYGPAIFSNPPGSGGQGAVLNANNSANSTANPAARGSTIQIFATGLGPTSPAVLAGVPAPSSPPFSLTTTTPQVLIGSKTATVVFSGLAPGFVGLYQVNAVVPNDVVPGSAVTLQIVTGGQTSSTVTIAVN